MDVFQRLNDDIMADEFELIEQYFAPLTKGSNEALNLKDDAAVLELPPEKSQVLTQDSLVANVHFTEDTPAALVAKKLVRVNLSDLAAMGATPHGVLISLMLPKTVDEKWVKSFSEGLKEECEAFKISVLGGDTVVHEGPLCLTLTAIGYISEGKALTRKGAKPGDKIFVSGTIGDGALGLLAAIGKLEANQTLIDRYQQPQPRIELGKVLHGTATACIDISDGLVQDCGQLGVGAVIQANQVPLSEEAKVAVEKDASLLETILTGGDDYELLFTCSPLRVEQVYLLTQFCGVEVTEIGEVVEGEGVKVVDEEGEELVLNEHGYKHEISFL